MTKFEGRTRGDIAMIHAAVHGPSDEIREIWSQDGDFKPPLEHWNDRDVGWNKAPSHSAAAGDWQFFAEKGGLVDVWRSEGLLGREPFSELYTAGTILALTLAYHAARPDVNRERIRREIRAIAGVLALTAAPARIHRSRRGNMATGEDNLYTHQRIPFEDHRQGPSVVIAGPRNNAASFGQKALSDWLALVSDWPGRRNAKLTPRMLETYGYPIAPPSGGRIRLVYPWTRATAVEDSDAAHWAAARYLDPLVGLLLLSRRVSVDDRGGSFERDGPRPYGIRPAEAEVLRAAIRGDREAAQIIVGAYLAGVKPHPLNGELHLLRDRRKTSAVMTRQASRNKPMIPISGAKWSRRTRRGIPRVTHYGVMPSTFRGVGATQAVTELHDTRLRRRSAVTVADGTWRVRVARGTRWHVVIDDEGARFAA